MKANLDVFGNARPYPSGPTPVIYLSHGFKSNSKNMEPCSALLQQVLPGATVHLFGYDWKQSVLRSGAELADLIFKDQGEDRPLYLVGHSMGGLVSRVANVILSTPGDFNAIVPFLSSFDYQSDVNRLKAFEFGLKATRRINGLVTLATPNSGAMLQGQVSSYLTLAQWTINQVASLRHPSVQDLTTDRLFRLLQHFGTSTPTLSMSGSRMNRFTLGSGHILRASSKIGLNLTLPHDLIVEDISVDLTKSILPNELTSHGRSPYLHLRAYENCADVTHTSIHTNQVMSDYIVDFVRRT
jgi:triacylglycerol esterase/lipase EstA (alpha/beta hydrolase family)